MTKLYLSHLELVDRALENAKLAGIDPDEEMVQFMWKIVRREVSKDDIEAWTRKMTAGARSNGAAQFVCAPSTGNAIHTASMRIQAGLDKLEVLMSRLASAHK